MVGADHKDYSDPRANDLQIWHRDIPQWKNIILQYSRYISYG
jgi:hypothetical protein